MKKLFLVLLLAGLVVPCLANIDDPDNGPPGVIGTAPFGIITPSQPTDPSAFTWELRANYPIAVRRHGAASDSTSLYVGGGQNPVTNAFYRYNTASNSWTQLANMPNTTCNQAMVCTGGKVYSMGGSPNRVQIYDIAGNSWTNGVTMPWSGSQGCSAATLGGDSIFVFFQGQCYKYTISSQTFTARPSLGDANAAFYGCATVVNNVIYIAGGFYSPQSHSAWSYRPSTGAWATLPLMAYDRNWPAVCGMNGMVYVAGGGYQWGAGVLQVEYFDPANPGLGWRLETNTLSSHNCTAGGVVIFGGVHYLHVVAGYTGSSYSNVNERAAGAAASTRDMGVTKILKPAETCISYTALQPKVRVKNFGTSADSTPVHLVIKLSGSEVYNQAATSPMINGGDSAEVTFPNWTPGMGGLTYDLISWTSYARDANPSNDTAKSQTKTITGVDVSVEDVRVAPTPVKVGADELITGTFQSNGALTSDFYANVKVYFGGKVVFFNSKLSSLDPGNAVDVTFDTWKPESVGTHRISVYCEADNDEYSDNDERSIYVDVLAVGDAGVTAIGIPPSVVSGQPVIVSVKAKNFTADPLTGVPVYCQVMSGDNLVYDENTTVDIPGNDEVDVPLPSWTPADPGDYSAVSYTLLPGDITPGNDTTRKAVTVTPPGGVAEKPTPTVFALTSIQPNPFRHLTAVSYALPRSARVRLAVYDVTGQLVRTVLDAPRAAGYHAVVWDGRDASGRLVAPGVYFCRFAAAGHQDARKLILTRD